jgi:aspartyl-tRNA synthetase
VEQGDADQEGPSKSALKKKAKEEEKARKKAEKAAKAKEAEQARAAGEEPVSATTSLHVLIYPD